MTDPIGMGVQLAANAARFGWYWGVNQIVGAETRRAGQRSAYKPKRPVPSEREILARLADLMMADAKAVREGIYPPMDASAAAFPESLTRVRAMLADLPQVLARREAADAASVRAAAEAEGVPGYYAQDFHFQSGGYLTDQSAQLYDVQVETLFYGAANAMRRAALAPIAAEMMGRDQRKASLLDVACGTGRLLRQIRLAWPALGLTGLDLSRPYLAEARRHMGELRSATLITGDAAHMPVEAASQDIVTSVFLLHELPPEVRREVAVEIARVLKPGGLLVLIDSLQMGDRPGWDGMLEAFPVRFHEPYYRHYATDDLDRMLTDAGLTAEQTSLVFLSKMLVRRKAK